MYVSSDQLLDIIIAEEDKNNKFYFYHRWENFLDDEAYPLIYQLENYMKNTIWRID
jgi:hypothetical protein